MKNKMMFEAGVNWGKRGIEWIEKVYTVEDRFVMGLPSRQWDFPHWSERGDGLICYYSQPLKPVATRIKPGKYLKNRFPELDDATVQEIVETISLKNVEVQWGTDYEAAYTHYFGGEMTDSADIQGIRVVPISKSCMKDNPNDCLEFYEHFDGLRIAYTLNLEGKTTARTLVNTTTKQFSRVYASSVGHAENLIKSLRSEGHEYNELALNNLVGKDFETDAETLAVPYLDGGNHGFDYDPDDGTVIIHLKNGQYRADSTSGLADTEPDHSNEFYCDNCSGWCHEDDTVRLVDGDFICEECYRDGNYLRCDDCGDVFHTDNDFHSDDSIVICDHCFNHNDWFYAYAGRYDKSLHNSDRDVVTAIGDGPGEICDGDLVEEHYAHNITAEIANCSTIHDQVCNGFVVLDPEQCTGMYPVRGRDNQWVYHYDHDTDHNEPVVDVDETLTYRLIKNSGGTIEAVMDEDELDVDWSMYCEIDGIFVHYHHFVPALPGIYPLIKYTGGKA